MIAPGDIAPTFALSGTRNERVELSADPIAGRFIVLVFASSERVPAFAESNELAELLENHNALGYVIAANLPSAPSTAADSALPVLIDSDGSVAPSYGLSGHQGQPVAVALAPNHHVGAVCTDPARFATERRRWLESVADQWQPRPAEAHPPVLIVPGILSADECRNLISVCRMQGNVFVEPGHGEQNMTQDYKMRVPGYGRHDRIDHWIINSETNHWLDDRFRKRLFPETHKAFQYRITRREHYRIGCYEGGRGGNPNGHRDNSEPRVAHRRFAVSVNLNTEAFAGGEIQFLEYSGRRYRPESGAALVFSSSLLHKILEVGEGRRYVLLAFLYGET